MDELLLGHAYRYCQWITQHHYENFPVASLFLPKEKRPFVAAVYAFARSADDFADEAKYQGRSLELLKEWRAALWACSDGSAHTEPFDSAQDRLLEGHPIFLALADTIQRCHLPVQLLDDLLTAFTLDVTKRRYADWQELLDYCRYSANPVGRLVLVVFGYADPELCLLSDKICAGLQLANHWQDLRIDLAKDLLYIPKTLMDQFGVSEEDLKQMLPDRSLPPESGFRALMQELVERADALFKEGEPLVEKVSGRLRLELKLTVLGGRAILQQIRASNYDLFRHRPVVSIPRKLKLLFDAVVS